MAANRRRSGGFPSADFNINMDDRSRGNDIFDDDDEENPFESLGRALDHCEELGAMMAGTQDQERTSEYYGDSSLQMPIPLKGPPTATAHKLSIDGNNDSIVDSSSMAALHTQDNDNERDYYHQKENRCDRSQMHRRHESTTTNEIRPQVQVESINNQSNTPIRNTNLTTQLSQASKQQKISPRRFTFQTSTKPKSTSFKTPSRTSLPTEDLFSSRAMSQRVTAKRSTRKSISNNESTQKRNQRHTFRNSMDRSNAPTADNNVREMRFVPTFLSSIAKVGSDNAHEDTPRENNDDDADYPHDEISPFTHNMVSNHHRQQQLNQSHRKSEQSTAGKSGYLVQRLRSLRNADQRMAMQLRSGQNSTSGLNCATMPRKRRRSGGDYLDPRNAASTIMDVTVSGASQAVCKFDEGKTVLLAYIHCYTTIKQPSEHSKDQWDKLKYPCFALILMSRDAVQEQGIVGSRSKQLRIYDGVVVPPRVAALDSDWNVSYEAKPDTEFHSKDMPTIIRTHICEEYPASVPLLPDVTFPPSSSSKM